MLAFILAVLVFYQLPELSPLWLGVVTVLAAGIVFIAPLQGFISNARHQRIFKSIVLGAVIGWSWAFWQSYLMPVVPERFLNTPLVVVGKIIELPKLSAAYSFGHRKTKTQYHLKLISIRSAGHLAEQTSSILNYQAWSRPTVVINWYQKNNQALDAMPKLGETWQFRVKLKANHASQNKGAFDYEAWLFQQHIAAKGYVKAVKGVKRGLKTDDEPINFTAKRVTAASYFELYYWRDRLASRLTEVFSESGFSAFYSALVFGDKSNISDNEWAVLQETGTIHLMAISGLHMGIVALIGSLIAKGIWWLGLYRIRWINLPTLMAVGGLTLASLYLMVSGFSIPTQRAWLMVLSILGFVLIQRKFQPWSALALAALMIVLWDSRSVLSFGFWLSFIAVGLIFILLFRPKKPSIENVQALTTTVEPSVLNQTQQVQVNKESTRWNRLKQGFAIQGVLTLGLAPFLIWAFQSVPLYSFIANLVAVPFMTLLGLPLLLLSSVAGLIYLPLGQWGVSMIDVLWGYLWGYLEWINQLPLSTVSMPALPVIWLVFTYIIIFWGLVQTSLKKQVLAGVLSIVLLIIFIIPTPNRPLNNQAWVSVLDVGQGQAIVIETQKSVTVFDTGAKWGSKTDGAKMAILPYLQHQKRRAIDHLIISHSDNDHAGGLLSLIEALPIHDAMSGQAEVINQRIFKYAQQRMKASNQPPAMNKALYQNGVSQCLAGQRWQVNGVLFEILSPNINAIGHTLKSDNDLSCVLKVTTGQRSLLITGDLSKKGEKILVQKAMDLTALSTLKADLLVAGHHGSQTATSQMWLKAVQPTMVVFSAGYLNRFNFPAPKVIQRLNTIHKPIQWWNTACSGQLIFKMTPKQIILQEQVRNTQLKWYHSRCLPSQQGHLFQ